MGANFEPSVGEAEQRNSKCELRLVDQNGVVVPMFFTLTRVNLSLAFDLCPMESMRPKSCRAQLSCRCVG